MQRRRIVVESPPFAKTGGEWDWEFSEYRELGGIGFEKRSSFVNLQNVIDFGFAKESGLDSILSLHRVEV
jgi:hypothetical protein